MKSHAKTISVAMCTYNGELYLEEQLDSIARQTRLPMEIIVCDDRSTDRTVNIVREFSRTAPFEVKLHINPVNLGSGSKGITRNFEHAVSMCKGELIFPCDQDDVWLPQKTAVMAAFPESDPEIGGVFSDGQLITADGRPKGELLSEATGLSRTDHKRLERGEGLAVVLAMDKIYGSSLMFDAKLLNMILPVPAHWWFDAWVGAIVSVYSRLAFTQTPLYLYRIHPNQNHGAAVPTPAKRIKQWQHSAKDYWEYAQPQLTELSDRIATFAGAHTSHHLEYLKGRMDLLRTRANLPRSRMGRIYPIMQQTTNYHRFFNGWRSIVKDLTA